MYELITPNIKMEKKLREYIYQRNDVKEKLDRLKVEPRKANGAHPLHGQLSGKWSCWLGSNIRLIYEVDDKSKKVRIYAIGSHKAY